MPVPRVAVCTIEAMDLFEQLSKTGQVFHAAYSCKDHPKPGARQVWCGQPPDEHGLLREVLLEEREASHSHASTILVMPPETFNSSKRAAIRVVRALLTCLEVADDSLSFCERDGWRAVSVAAAWPGPEICRLLVERRAEVGALNRKGQSALHLAGRAGFHEVLNWLSARAGRQIVDLLDHHGNTAQMYGQQALAASMGRGRNDGTLASQARADAA
eukprot:s210_g18.t1